jgi:hypothetical protein
MARVRGVTRLRIVSRLMHMVFLSTSHNTGRPPHISAAFAVAPQVIVGTITSSPGRTPTAN